MAAKICDRCHLEFPLNRFSKRTAAKDGLRKTCKDCDAAYQAKFRASNPHIIQARLDYRRTRHRRDPRHGMYWDAKQRAKSYGMAFDICIDDIVIPERCPVFGRPFVIGNPDWAPSIDKIVPSLGYMKGNIQVISRFANIMKNKATPEQLICFATWVLSQLDGFALVEEETHLNG
jgi:hypothetical protein